MTDLASTEATETDAPAAHEGVTYPNASSKPLRGPLSKAYRDDVQRVVWSAFFVLVLAVFAVAVTLSLVGQQ